jgi:hypothetical protein
MFRQDFTCPALLKSPNHPSSYGAITRSGPPFHAVPIRFLGALASSAFARHY